MDELIARLTAEADALGEEWPTEAATLIEQLRADNARMAQLLAKAWHYVSAIEEYEGKFHTLRWEQALVFRKEIGAALQETTHDR